MRTFKIDKDPYERSNLYYRNSVTFEPGITILIGCNGCGKTSLLNQIQYNLSKENIPYTVYDNLKDGEENARSKAGFLGDLNFLATAIQSSEGENIIMNMCNIARQMGALAQKYSDAKELWFLFDAVDSGLSIDNIIDLKEDLFEAAIKYNPDKEIYIIASANEYELCHGEKCFDTYLCKYINIRSYKQYKNFILRSRKRKDKREKKYNQ